MGQRGTNLEQPPNQATDPLTLLEAALDAAIAQPLFGLTDAERFARAEHVYRAKAKMDALRARTARNLATASTIPSEARTAAQHLGNTTSVDPCEVREDARLGAWLQDFPEFDEAYATGTLGRAYVKLLRQVVNPRTRLDMRDSQSYLLNAAVGCDVKEFRQLMAYWSNAADPDGAEPKDQTASTGCTFKENADGSVSGKFYFDPLSGGAFKTMMGHESEKQYKADQEQQVQRSTRQRAAIALLNLLRRGFQRPDGSFPAPLINIVMGEKLAEDILQNLADPDHPVPPASHTGIDRRCELIDGTPLHPALAALALVVGRFQRMIFDADSMPVDVAATTRSFPKMMKQILMVRARGRCQSKGCDAPFPWLEADHVHPHSKGGATTIANGQILCSADNKRKRDHLETRATNEAA